MVSGTVEDFSDRQISSKPKRVSSSTCPRALSTMASGQGCPYFSSRGFSRLPAFTPMRIGMCLARQASATAFTFSGAPILPGLMRILSMPRSAASSASR